MTSPALMGSPTPMSRADVQRRTVRMLSASQALSGVGIGIGVGVGSLLTQQITGSATLAGLPQTGSVLGGALAAVPLSRVMGRFGRRPGLVAGYLVGALGASGVVLSTVLESLPVLLMAMALFGVSTATSGQARFAATDLADARHRSRALATVVWATTVGAVAGPNLMGPSADLARGWGLPQFAGPFLWSILAFGSAALLLLVGLRPDPLLLAQSGEHVDGVRPTRASLASSFDAVRRSPHAAIGLASVAVSHTVMVAVMVMTPVHMGHAGMGALRVIGLVISIHVAGMYAFSPVVGWLSDRVGRLRTSAIGWALLLTATVLAGTAAPHNQAQLSVGLFLLGLGWSCGLVSGSTLVSESVPAQVRTGVQGLADLVMGLSGALGGAAAGFVVGLASFGVLAALAASLVLGLVVAAVLSPAKPWRHERESALTY